MSSDLPYRTSTLTRTVVTSTSSYHVYTTSYTTTSTNTNTNTTSVIGIHSQPYRNYLTERNHFYHSASQPTTFTSTSATSRPSTIISSIQQTSSQQAGQQQQPTPTQSKHQQSLFSALGIHTKFTGSKQSLNSTNSANHNNSNNHHQKMAATVSQSAANAANNKHRSNSSLAIDGAYHGGAKSSSMADNIDDEDDYDLYHHSACSKFCYGFLWLLAQVGLFGAVAALVYWFFKYDKGFAYQNDKRKMYNLHAFLMLTGFIFVNGQSMLIYKTYLCCKKIYNKIMHAFFFVISIGLVSFGFLIGFQAQSISSSPDQQVQHFYSLHSWIGLVACALFALQFLFGFITFLVLLCCDRSTAGFRSRFLPTHITFGIIIFILAIAACLAGLLQTARSRLAGPSLTEPGRADYRDMRLPEDFNIFMNAGIVINLVGACLLLLAILMPYLVLNFRHNRPPATFHVN